MTADVLSSELTTRLARDADDIRAAQRLRYEVFVKELGAAPAGADHAARREADHFDRFADHILLYAQEGQDPVGVTRVLLPEQAQAAGGYYSSAEFDLSPLERSGRRLLELGRTCLHPAYRGGTAMHTLWQGLSNHVQAHNVELLFGVASFHGTDINALMAPLMLLQERHLAPHPLRVTAREDALAGLSTGPIEGPDRRAALRQVPSLIKAYLRLGATVGQGAYLDRDFNTTDLCMILDPKTLPRRQAARFGQAVS